MRSIGNISASARWFGGIEKAQDVAVTGVASLKKAASRVVEGRA